MKPVFILFNGFGSSKLWWNYKLPKKSSNLTKLNFINKLKRIGYVYQFNNKIFNLDYYNYYPNSKQRLLWNKIYKKYKPHDKNINFKLKDIDYKNICKSLYKNIKSKYKKNKFILIGHSYGCEIALLFSKLYKKECLFNVLLDGSVHDIKSTKQYQLQKKDENITKKYFQNNNQLKKILNIIKNNNESNKEINLVWSLLEHMSLIYKLNYFQNKLPVYSIFIKRLDSNDEINNKINQNEFKTIKKFNKDKMYKYILVSTDNHFIWFEQNISDLIINEIKNNI